MSTERLQQAINKRLDKTAESVSSTRLIALDSYVRVLISGNEREQFLQNLLSNDIKKITSGMTQWSSLNSAKGRVIANMLVSNHDDSYELLLRADIAETVSKKLKMFVLRSKVGITLPEPQAMLGLLDEGNTAKAAMQNTAAVLWLNNQLGIITSDAEAALAQLPATTYTSGNNNDWSLALVRHGLPFIDTASSEEFVAQMINLDLVGGISFKKGCYPGQEIVARTQYLGKLKKRTYRLRSTDNITAGEDLFHSSFGEQSVGRIIAAAQTGNATEVLAVCRSELIADGQALQLKNGAALSVLDLPYSVADENQPAK